MLKILYNLLYNNIIVHARLKNYVGQFMETLSHCACTFNMQ